MVLIDGKLFRLGNGFLFEPIGKTPFACMDLLVVFISGLSAGIILMFLNKRDK